MMKLASLVVLIGCSLSRAASAGDKAGRHPADADVKKDWEKATQAQPVAKGSGSLVYKFSEVVNGKTVQCYFIDTLYTGSSSARGGITCVRMD